MSEEYYAELVITSDTLTPEHLNSVLGMECNVMWHAVSLAAHTGLTVVIFIRLASFNDVR